MHDVQISKDTFCNEPFPHTERNKGKKESKNRCPRLYYHLVVLEWIKHEGSLAPYPAACLALYLNTPRTSATQAFSPQTFLVTPQITAIQTLWLSKPKTGIFWHLTAISVCSSNFLPHLHRHYSGQEATVPSCSLDFCITLNGFLTAFLTPILNAPSPHFSAVLLLDRHFPAQEPLWSH